MIIGYRFTRQEIVDKIKSTCKKTKDGIYWMPKITPFISLPGLNEDKEYCYPREDFAKKIYFTDFDFLYFLTTKALNNHIYAIMRKIDASFLSNNYDTIGLELKQKVVPYDFTLEELLNNYINLRYAVFAYC